MVREGIRVRWLNVAAVAGYRIEELQQMREPGAISGTGCGPAGRPDRQG